MSDYKKMVHQEAKSFLEETADTFRQDSAEHGGQSNKPNLTLWLDGNRKLFSQLDETTKNWSRADAEFVTSHSRNAMGYGDPKQSAYYAFYKDTLTACKKFLKKS